MGVIKQSNEVTSKEKWSNGKQSNGKIFGRDKNSQVSLKNVE